MKIKDVVVDKGIFPRARMDYEHVAHLVAAYANGADVPRIIVEGGTHRVVDGFHRLEALRILRGGDFDVAVEERQFDGKVGALLGAMKLNWV